MIIATLPEDVKPVAEQKEEAKPETTGEAGEKSEAKKKKKKKEKKEGEKETTENKEEAKEETKPTEPIDVEKRIQEIMKNKAKAGQSKKQGLNLDSAKQEILARQQKKTKKKYEDL